MPGKVADVHDIPSFEKALDARNAHAQQGFAAFLERHLGPVVDHDAAFRGVAQGDPQLVARDLVRLEAGAEQGSHRLALRDAHQGIGLVALAYGERDARDHEHACGPDLGDHAAAAHLGAHAACNAHDVFGHPIHAADQLGLGIVVGVGVVEALHIAEDDAMVGLHQAGDDRRERIVVAEFDFLDRSGVVLVHDGHHAEVQKPVQGIARMQVCMAARGIVPGQKHNGSEHPILFEDFGIGGGQNPLPYRCGGLQARNVMGTLLDAQLVQADGDSAGRNHDRRPAHLAQLLELTGQIMQVLTVQPPLLVDKGGRTDLHNQSTGCTCHYQMSNPE